MFSAKSANNPRPHPNSKLQANKIQDGATIHFLGIGDPDHLEAHSSYFMRRGQVMRALSRQLFSYPPTETLANPTAAFDPAPDIAIQIPTVANGGITSDRRTYIIRLRDGVCWDTSPPREVTAQDFIRGLKRLADPAVGAGALDYFTSTIAGMQEYYDNFAANCERKRAAAVEKAQYHNLRDIAGVHAHDEKTLIFTLKRPANDFLHLLAMGFASPAPREYDANPPERERFFENLISLGPYRVAPASTRADAITLVPNPAWTPQTDQLRRQDFAAIHLKLASTTRKDIPSKIESAAPDPAWQFSLVSWGRPAVDSRPFPACYPGYTLNPYLVFNLQSQNAGGAMRQLQVRKAIAYAVNKHAVCDIFKPLHGVAVEPLNSVIPPGSVGHSNFDPYPTPGGRGDAAKARRILKAAGFADGLQLKAAVRDVAIHLDTMTAIAKDLLQVGIDLQFEMYNPADYYAKLLCDPARARAGDWDLAEVGWTPDWWGNNGRAITLPLFQSNFEVGTTNYGGYSNPLVDQRMEQALQEANPIRASDIWRNVDRLVMQDLPILPLLAFACKCCVARSSPGWGTWQGLASLARS